MSRIEHQDFYSGIGDVMHHIRKASPLSKHKISTSMGVSISKYIAMEEGLEEPSLYDLYFFADAVGVPFDELLSQIAAVVKNPDGQTK